jgi:hypothetical protein
MAKAAFSFHQQIALTFKEETSKMLHLEHSFVWRRRRMKKMSESSHVK